MIILISCNSYSQEECAEIVSWEPDDLETIYSSFDSTQSYIIKPSIIFANKLIRFYQTKISTQSISRCPFYISCSNYAYLSIKKHGLILGICYFIDRNFYRENISSNYQYGLRETEYGILKLDDSFYIFGKE
jgi:putative component of membrane protein insertase Oxa1/YidC/SpoIIIJ protein YidD